MTGWEGKEQQMPYPDAAGDPLRPPADVPE